MQGQAVYDTIKTTIHSILPNSKVLLFGSRARGEETRFSDYDLMVILPGLYSQDEKMSWSSAIDKAVVRAIRAPIDLLLFTEDEIEEKRHFPGHIVRTAMREGVEL